MLLSILKTLGLICFVLLAVVGCQVARNGPPSELVAKPTDALRVGTYNVHYIIVGRAEGAWSLGDWDRRKGPLDLAFKDIAADVIGFQEMESFAFGNQDTPNLTLNWLLDNNPDYKAAAVGDPAVFPSTQPILYRTARLRLLDQGWFFFSKTPDVIYSRTFNGSFPAFASWAQFQDQDSGAVFRVLNIHTDYASQSNRRQSVALAATRMQPWVDAGENIFVIGDLNARLGSETLKTFSDIGVTFAPIVGSTYHFNRGTNLFGAIDHIGFLGTPQLAGAPIVVRQKYAGEWPTDHYPVIADFQFAK